MQYFVEICGFAVCGSIIRMCGLATCLLENLRNLQICDNRMRIRICGLNKKFACPPMPKPLFALVNFLTGTVNGNTNFGLCYLCNVSLISVT